jgi:hypothetical protein
MPIDISIQQAGTWPLYRLTLTRGSDPLPLTGATAVLIATHSKYSGWVIHKDLTVENPAMGTLLCDFTAMDTVHPGTYNIKLTLVWVGGSSITLPLSGSYQMEIGPALDIEDLIPEPLRVYSNTAGLLSLVAIIDVYDAIEWGRKWRTPGDWQVVVSRYATGANEIKEGRFIFLTRAGKALIGRIESIDGQMTDEGVISEKWTVHGRCSGIILADRICLAGTSSGTGYDTQTAIVGETAMRHYVDGNAVSPTDTNRTIPNLVLEATDQTRGLSVTVSARFEPVPDILESIALQSRLGWDISYDFTADEFVFNVLEGSDRSGSVLLSPRIGNCLISGYKASISDTPSVVIVGGQGEDASRTLVEVGTSTGWDRREGFEDASNLDTTAALTARGEEIITAIGDTTVLEVQYVPTPTYRYGIDFDLGDIVSAEYPDICTIQARIIAVTEQYPSGNIIITLGKEWPDLVSVIRNMRKQPAGTRK